MNRKTIHARLSETTAGRWGSGMLRAERVERGDHDLNPGMNKPAELVPAAVLVPIVERSDGMTVLLTQRTDHLTAHAGQISFPGGRVELEDVSIEAAALRETEEEVGLLGSPTFFPRGNLYPLRGTKVRSLYRCSLQPSMAVIG